MVLPLGLWLLWALAASQEICRSPGELPAPLLIMDKGSAHHGESIILLCFVPTDTSATRVIFCKDGKEISTLPMDRKKMFFESVQPASPESMGNYSCRYQHKDDRNQEKNSLPSASRYLSAPDGDSPAKEECPQGPAIPLWVWILRSALVLLLLASSPIISCILRGRAIVPLTRKALEGNGREEEEGEVAKGSGGLPCLGKPGGSAGVTEKSLDYTSLQKQAHGIQGE